MRQLDLRLRAASALVLIALVPGACLNNSPAPTVVDNGDASFPDDAAPYDAGADTSIPTVDAAEASADDSGTDTGAADAPEEASALDATTVDSSALEAGATDASDGAILGPAVYVDATNGNDTTGDGSSAHPYQTVSKAGSIAVSGDTIYLAAGSYTLQTAAVTLADGVGIAALTYGTAKLAPASGASYGLTFAKSGFAHGLLMHTAYINAAVGTVTLDGVQYENIADPGSSGSSCINVSGTGHVIVTPGGLTSYLGASVSSFASVIGAGILEIHGGTLAGAATNAFDGSALINASGTAQVLLDGVTISGGLTSAIVMSGTPQVTLENKTAITNTAGHGGSAWSLNINSGSPVVVLDDSNVTSSPQTGFYVNGGSTPSLTFRNGASIAGSVGQGLFFQGGAGTIASTLVFDDASVTNNGSNGVQLGGGVFNLTARGSQFTGNGGNGIGAALTPGSVIDLGNATTAGANTISGNAVKATSASNVAFTTTLTAADLTIQAVGNTWTPNGNGADSSGHFPAATTLQAPPTVSGQNVQLTQSGTSTFFLKLVAAP